MINAAFTSSRVSRALAAATLAGCLVAASAALAAPATDGGTAAPAAASAAPTDEGSWSHAYVAFGGTPKYPKDFKAFEWVNPDAPRGGTVVEVRGRPVIELRQHDVAQRHLHLTSAAGHDLRQQTQRRRESAAVGRQLKRLHVRGLIAKLPRSRRCTGARARGHALPRTHSPPRIRSKTPPLCGPARARRRPALHGSRSCSPRSPQPARETLTPSRPPAAWKRTYPPRRRRPSTRAPRPGSLP